MAFKVFFSYAHRDEQLLEKLQEHLAPLKNQGLIDRVWYDREISGGTEWEPEIIRHLETANIILLLVSSAFMNSDYCYGKELQRAIQRHERREARVVPIILSPCDWQIPPLNKLQALPTDGKPVTGAAWHSVDEAMLNVVKGLRTVIKDLQKRSQNGSSYQYQIDYINQQMAKGISARDALYQCDPQLGNLFDSISYQDYYRMQLQAQHDHLQSQVEKLVSEVSGVGEGDFRVQAEVTADALGVLADSFNYIVEELAKVVGRIRATTSVSSDWSRKILDAAQQQHQISLNIAEGLKILSKSLQDETSSEQFSKITNLLLEVLKRSEIIGGATTYLEELFEQLRASVSTFRLPE